jgi:chromosomal replication initiator protein
VISSVFSIPVSPSQPAGDGLEFIAGPENALVREALKAAVTDRLPFNPIVVCGPSGVGKSLLAHLLAEHRQRALALRNVVVTSGAELAQALASASEAYAVAALRTRYHRADILLIDDVQQLANRHAAQQFLETTVDVLVRRGALVLATLRLLPAATDALAPTLASRLQGGLVVPLALPQELARKAIVRQAAAQAGLTLSPEQIDRLAVTARRLKTAPHLRRAVLQLAQAALSGERPSPSSIDAVLAPGDADLKQLVRQVASAVAKENHITLGELKGPTRRQSVTQARSLAMCLVRRLSGASYAEIGRHFGGRDHTTVLHACRKIERQAQADGGLSRQLAEWGTQIASMTH